MPKAGLKAYVMKVSRMARTAVFRTLFLRLIVPARYKSRSRRPVDAGKAVLVSHEGEFMFENTDLIERELTARGVRVSRHVLDKNAGTASYVRRSLRMIDDIADSPAVFVTTGSALLSRTACRPETVFVQTWHGCGAFKKFGLSSADGRFGDAEEEMISYPAYRNDTFVTVSSREVVWCYEEAMGVGKVSRARVVPSGVSRTDSYFDKAFIDAARKKVEDFTGGKLDGKKIILYAPTFRGHTADAHMPQALDVEALARSFADSCVLIVKYHPFTRNRITIPPEFAGFAFDATGTLDTPSLLACADVCVSDYSSVVFEYSLFSKPMIFFAFDLEDYDDWRGFYYPYAEFCPGPVVRDNAGLIDALRSSLESFDPALVARFREKFMGACDGHATERAVALAFGECASDEGDDLSGGDGSC